jgi:hypothetical protein
LGVVGTAAQATPTMASKPFPLEYGAAPNFMSNVELSPDGKEEFIFLYRPVGGSGWDEYYRLKRDSFEDFNYAGLVEGEPDMIYVTAHNGSDREGL